MNDDDASMRVKGGNVGFYFWGGMGVWWFVWGLYGFWWGVLYGLFWPVWAGYRLADFLL